MNILKINQEVIKRLYLSWGEGYDNTVCAGEYPRMNCHYVVIGGVQIYLLSKEDIYFDTTKCEKISENILNYALNRDGHEKAHFTGEIFDLGKGKLAYKLLTDDESKFAWVDKKLLAPFGKDNEYTLLIDDPMKPILVEQDGELVGCVMPCRVKINNLKESVDNAQ